MGKKEQNPRGAERKVMKKEKQYIIIEGTYRCRLSDSQRVITGFGFCAPENRKGSSQVLAGER